MTAHLLDDPKPTVLDGLTFAPGYEAVPARWVRSQCPAM